VLGLTSAYIMMGRIVISKMLVGNLRIKAENFQVLGNADNEAQIETSK
jgi:hypothetical protein